MQEKKSSVSDLKNLDWAEIKLRLSSYATCDAARVALAAISPLESAEKAESSFSEIEAAIEILAPGVRPYCQSLDLYSTWFQRLQKKATLRTIELRDVRQFCIEVVALKEVIAHFNSSWATRLTHLLMAAEEPLSAIDQIMTPEGEIRFDASETMFRLWNEKNQQSRLVQNTLDRILRNAQLENVLQEKYVTTREGRWVVPIKSNMRHGLEGIIHAASQTKQTVYVEPQDAVPINNRIREIEIEIELEIERLLIELSEYLARLNTDFSQSRDILLEFDIRASQAQLATALQAQRCFFSEDKSQIHLINLRHPLLTLKPTKVIPSQVNLDLHHRILLLSGPNAGGKTVLLKSIGLAAQMARCGLLICADQGSKIPFFESITVSIGDQQSVDANLSTFAAHLKTLDEASKKTGPSQLLLIDEICGSTDPEEGAALARSFILKYAENQVFAVVSSHLGTLKAGWPADYGVTNGSLEFDKEKGPTYQFLMGVPGQSLALQTAKRVGVQDEIVKKALEFLTPEHRQYQRDLEQVDVLRQELSRLKRELENEKTKTEKEKERFTAIIEKFQKEKEIMLNQSIKRAEKKVETIIRESKIDDIFKRHQELEKIKNELPVIIKAKPGAAFENNSNTISDANEFAEKCPPGTKVLIKTINREGLIQSKPNSKGEVQVLSQSMRLSVQWSELQPSTSTKNPTADILRRSKNFSFLPQDQDRTVDLRGRTSDEALALLEQELDSASLQQEDRIKIIHGHGGSDILKKSVRTYLSRSIYVKKWQAGSKENGGDGITWAEIKD